MENGKHTIYDFAMDTPDPKKYLLETLDVGFDSFKCAAKLNVAECRRREL